MCKRKFFIALAVIAVYGAGIGWTCYLMLDLQNILDFDEDFMNNTDG